MSDGTLHLPDPAPTRDEIEKALAAAQERVAALRADLAEVDMKAALEADAARAATSCPALAEVMRRLDDIEDAIRSIAIFQFPQITTTPGTIPYVPGPLPFKPYVPWWETNKIWCSSDNAGPQIRATYGATGGTDFDGEY